MQAHIGPAGRGQGGSMQRGVGLFGIGCLLVAATTASAQQASVTVFVGVHVVPMIQEQVLRNQTVVVTGDRITAIGPNGRVAVPEGATRIDGRGKFLMPGLTDMHVHFYHPIRPSTRAPHVEYIRHSQDLALLFVANGVTTVRNMWGTAAHLTLRKEIEAGHVLGPRIATTGVTTDGVPATWPSTREVRNASEAAVAVSADHDAGFDAVKVYTGLSAEACDGIVAAARRIGMPVWGHVPTAVGLSRVLASGRGSIEHGDGYLRAAQLDSIAPTAPARPETVDPKKLADLVAATVAANVWNCPTLTVIEKVTEMDRWPALKAIPLMRFVPPPVLAGWNPTLDFRYQDAPAERRAAAQRRFEFSLS